MTAVRVSEFDLWQPGYGNAVVSIYQAGTTTPLSCFLDEALTVAADNPQTLLSKIVAGVDYGKFEEPIYVGAAYTLKINSTDETGVVRPPLTTLDGEDASAATAIAANGTQARAIEDILADEVNAEAFGTFSAVSASGNTTILDAAIAAAASIGGGEVIIPEGTWPFNQITLSQGVVLRGRGRDVTVLQSQVADKAVTLSGDRAGFRRLTLDGVSLQVGSTGVFSKANDETVFDDVMVKRFETGIHFKGGYAANWNDLYVDNCTSGAKLHGDLDAGNGSDGQEFSNNRWQGGLVSICTGFGVELSYEDQRCWHNTIADVGFESNTGTAVKINGARWTSLPGCWWYANTNNLAVQDDSDTTKTDNTVIGLRIREGAIDSGISTFAGLCQDVVLSGMELTGGTYTLALITNPILAVDCVEDATLTINGVDANKWVRRQSIWESLPASAGLTSDATATEAWSINLEPGQVVNIRAVVIGRQRNGTDYARYHVARSARRPGSTLAYQAQTANFTLGEIITGATSGATARIVADSDSGATGTLTLIDITGVFQNNETLTGALGGSATANGTLVAQNAALLGSTTSIEAAVESDANWACDFAANQGEIQLLVTGAAAKTIEWTAGVEVVSS